MVFWLLLLSAAYPLCAAWRATRRTPLVQAVQWALVAWAAWGAALGAALVRSPAEAPARYLALSLTGCAGVAVLGARRPGVTAWNFVVAGLLAVLLLPLLEGLDHLSPPRQVFLGAIVGVGLLNYLPTRFAPAALLLAIGCTTEFLTVVDDDIKAGSLAELLPAGQCLLAVSPWIALARAHAGRRSRSEFDRHWRTFRDRFGLLWGLRVREQFNRAAANAGWPVELHWLGLRRRDDAATDTVDPDDQKEMMVTLRALLKRFGPEEEQRSASGRRSPG